MGFRRQKRLTEYPLPEALAVSFERSKNMDRLQLQTWSEATAVNIDRLLSEYHKTREQRVIWEAHHQTLQLVGMVQALADQALP